MFKSTLTIIALFSFLLVSCDKSEDPEIDPTASVEGQWNVTTVKTTYQTKGTTAQVSDIDLSKEAVFFQFNSDGTYSTNAKINLTSITKSDKVFDGTYKLSKDKIELEYFLEDFSITAKFNFNLKLASN